MEFTGKNKVDNIMGAKSHALIGQKQQNSFQLTHTANFFVSISGEQASEHFASSFPFSNF